MAVEVTGLIAAARWRSSLSVLVACVVMDLVVVGLFVVFRHGESPRTGWAVLLLVPVVMAAAHQSRLVRWVQAIGTVAALVIVLAAAPGSVSSLALDAAVVSGSLLASAWVTDRLFRQVRNHLSDLRVASHTDRLTGVLNRRGLHAAYTRVAGEAAASDQPISVITADLDAMKQINDIYGHAVGDQVLQQLTDRLTRAAPGALVARIGGDEHVIVVVGNPEPVLGEIRLLLQADPLSPAAEVSFGTAAGPAVPELDALWALIDRADKKLYEDKRRVPGRRTRNINAEMRAPVDSRPNQQAGRPANGVGRLLPTREQRQLYAAVIILDAVVCTASAVLQALDKSGGRGPNFTVLGVGLSVAAILVWWVLRPGAAQSFFTGVVVAAAAVLTMIALVTDDKGTSDVGLVMWAPLLLLAARYWPRAGLIGIYGWLIIMATSSHLLHTGIGFPASVKVLLQVGALIVAAEVLYHLRRREETLVEQLTSHALTDPLTGLANRRGLEAATLRLLPGDVTALMIDIDRFKQVNDEHGHQAGDQTLVAVARILTTRSPAETVIARLGGDEFLIVGKHLDPNELMTEFQEATEALPTPVSLSAGSAHARLDNDDQGLWQLINTADQDLLAGRIRH